MRESMMGIHCCEYQGVEAVMSLERTDADNSGLPMVTQWRLVRPVVTRGVPVV
jgi:hypothetical protein